MSDRLNDIRTRLEAATPGPWQPDTQVRGDCVIWGPNGQFIANHQAEPHWLPDANGGRRAVAFDVDRRDCEFIAHARDDIAWLLSELSIARGLIQSARGETVSLGDFTKDDAL